MSRIKLSILLLSICVLAGCSFRPVHAKLDSNLANQLESIQVSDVKSRADEDFAGGYGAREAQVLKYKLQELLTPAGSAGYPVYRLDIDLIIEKGELGIQENLRVTRYDIIETANYKLISLANNQIVKEGKVRIKSSFNRTSSEFSTFVAEEDASEKAAEELAQEIKQRLVAFFAR